MTTSPNDADNELRVAIIDGLAATTTGFHSSQLEALWPLIQADRQRTRQAVLDEVRGVIGGNELQRPFPKDSQLDVIRISVRNQLRAELRQAITALKAGKE